MGKWLARLREMDAPSPGGTAKTAKTPLLAVLAVPPGGAMPQISPSLSVRARLMRWGWSLADVDRVAARIDSRASDDPRRMCLECLHYRPAQHQCADHRRALLLQSDVGPALAGLLQRCPAHVSAPQESAQVMGEPAVDPEP